MAKKAKIVEKPEPVKRAKYNEPIIDDGLPLAWRFGHVDSGGPFAWNFDVAQYHDVVHKLFEFESKNWSEITASGSHPIEIGRLCKKARERLTEIEKDDLDELLSLRLTGTNRVWCVRTGHIVRPLWWDADHKVYPVAKDRGDREKANRRKTR